MGPGTASPTLTSTKNWLKAISGNTFGRNYVRRPRRQLTLRLQLHGEIVAATADGIDIELHGNNEGDIWRMPPIEDLSLAKPGIYELSSTGEAVENPDLSFP